MRVHVATASLWLACGCSLVFDPDDHTSEPATDAGPTDSGATDARTDGGGPSDDAGRDGATPPGDGGDAGTACDPHGPWVDTTGSAPELCSATREDWTELATGLSLTLEPIATAVTQGTPGQRRVLVAYVHANTAQLAAWTPGGSAVPLADLLGASGSSLRVRSVALRRQGSCGVAFAVQGDEESEPGLRFGIYDACTLTFALPGAPPGTLGGTSTPVIALSRDGEHSRAFAPLADRSLYAIAFEPTEVLARISELPAVPALVLGTVVPRALVDTPGDAVHWFDTASTGADVIMTDERTAGTSPIFATVDENVDIVGWAYRSGIDDVVRLRALGASCASPLGDRTFLGPPGPMAAASMPGGGAVVAMAHAADGVVLRFVDRHLGDVRASETEATLGLPFAADGAAVDRTLAVDAWDDADFVYVAVAARVVESGTVTIRAAFLSIPKCGVKS